MPNRRDFMKTAAVAAGAGLLGTNVVATAKPLPLDENGKYVLPPLKYDYDAIERAIDKETVRLHHDIHHNGYVKGLNASLDKLAQARESGDYDLVQYYTNKVSFHGSGHVLHTIYWDNMSPDGGGRPSGKLLKAIEKDFGSFEQFKANFIAASSKVEGSGWGILAWEPLGEKLIILQAEKHNNLTVWGAVPLLVVDVWEHSYYLKYQNKRGDYVKAFFDVVDWKDVAERYEVVSQ